MLVVYISLLSPIEHAPESFDPPASAKVPVKHYQKQDTRAKCLVAAVVPSHGNMEARGVGTKQQTTMLATVL